MGLFDFLKVEEKDVSKETRDSHRKRQSDPNATKAEKKKKAAADKAYDEEHKPKNPSKKSIKINQTEQAMKKADTNVLT